MKKVKHTFLIFEVVVLFVGCKSIDRKMTSQFKDVKLVRFVSIFSKEDSKQEKFDVEKKETKEIVFYEYTTERDSLRSLRVEFHKRSKQLFFIRAEFYKFRKKSFKYNNLDFTYFKHKPSSQGLILFNQEYGILAISDLYGASLILLENRERDLVLERKILKVLNEYSTVEK